VQRYSQTTMSSCSDDFLDENELSVWLQDFLAPDFFILPEVSGKHLIEKTGTRIDFLLMPKPHIVATGFPQIIFGIEVKYITKEETCKQVAKVYMQAIAYANSVFNVGKQFTEYMNKAGIQCDPFVRPAFVLVFSNLFFRQGFITKKEDRETFERHSWVMYGMSKIAAHQKVGDLKITRYKSAIIGYQMFLFDEFFSTLTAGSLKQYSFSESKLKNLLRTNGGNMDNRKIRRVIGGYRILDEDDFALHDEENWEACGNDIELDEEYYIAKYLED